MKLQISDEAKEDLREGFHFYEKQAAGLGAYFLDSLFSDIDSLLLYAGIHHVVFGSHRCLSHRFPFAIYYKIEDDGIRVRAILDCRQQPGKARRRLSQHP